MYYNLFQIYPEGLRKLLVWLKKEYGDMEIFITENGLASYDIGLDDHDRVEYYKEHLEQVRNYKSVELKCLKSELILVGLGLNLVWILWICI